jgi:rhodanese-related sulfurtransferase
VYLSNFINASTHLFDIRFMSMEGDKVAAVVKRMTAVQLGLILNGDARELYQIVDVREPDELAVASIKGKDILNLALGDAGTWSPSVQQGKLLDADKPVVCICHHGMRSMKMANFLIQNGFDDVYNVDGGIHKYAENVDPSIPTY